MQVQVSLKFAIGQARICRLRLPSHWILREDVKQRFMLVAGVHTRRGECTSRVVAQLLPVAVSLLKAEPHLCRIALSEEVCYGAQTRTACSD
jgi:hypothetical protein